VITLWSKADPLSRRQCFCASRPSWKRQSLSFVRCLTAIEVSIFRLDLVKKSSMWSTELSDTNNTTPMNTSSAVAATNRSPQDKIANAIVDEIFTNPEIAIIIRKLNQTHDGLRHGSVWRRIKTFAETLFKPGNNENLRSRRNSAFASLLLQLPAKVSDGINLRPADQREGLIAPVRTALEARLLQYSAIKYLVTRTHEQWLLNSTLQQIGGSELRIPGETPAQQSLARHRMMATPRYGEGLRQGR
jgi:hypothetical protein